MRRPGESVDAYIEGKKIRFNANSAQPIRFLIKHELTHAIEKMNNYFVFANEVFEGTLFDDWLDSKGYESLQEYRKQYIEDRIEAKDENFVNETDTDKLNTLAEQEILADFIGDVLFAGDEGINRLLDGLETKTKRTVLEWLRDVFRTLKNKITKADKNLGYELAALERKFTRMLNQIEKSEDGQNKKSTAKGVKYEISDTLHKQLQDWQKGLGKAYGTYNGKYFDLGTTPNVLIKHGAKNLPIIMTEDVLLKITGGKHAIPLSELGKLPNQINDPILLFKGNYPNSFVILTEAVDINGNDVIVIVHLNKTQDRIKVNNIASAYSKSDEYGRNKILSYVDNQIKAGNLLDASIKKAPNWFTSKGLQLPELVQTILDANNRIPQGKSSVNSIYMQNGKKNSITIEKNDEYLTAVKNNDVKTAQKLVDEAAKEAGYTVKGYHGSPYSFYKFDRAKIGLTDYGLFGRGFYFSNDSGQSNE